MISFTGRKSGPRMCEFCDEIAVYVGQGLKDNYPRSYNLCAVHGPSARHDHFIMSLDELPEFKSWKRKQDEAKQRHPSTQTSFLNEA